MKWKDLSNMIKRNYNYFPIDNLIFTYDDNKKINVISEDGKIHGPEKAKEELKRIKLSRNDDALNSINNVNMIDDSIPDFIVFSDRLYTAYFYAAREYYKRNEKIKKALKSIKDIKNVELNEDNYYFKLIGYDNDNNAYWYALENDNPSNKIHEVIVIYSNQGVLIDAFYFGEYINHKNSYENYETTQSIPAVASNGDIYFMLGTKEGYHFWKVERQW